MKCSPGILHFIVFQAVRNARSLPNLNEASNIGLERSGKNQGIFWVREPGHPDQQTWKEGHPLFLKVY